jgi:hypothetical protein
MLPKHGEGDMRKLASVAALLVVAGLLGGTACGGQTTSGSATAEGTGGAETGGTGGAQAGGTGGAPAASLCANLIAANCPGTAAQMPTDVTACDASLPMLSAICPVEGPAFAACAAGYPPSVTCDALGMPLLDRCAAEWDAVWACVSWLGGSGGGAAGGTTGTCFNFDDSAEGWAISDADPAALATRSTLVFDAAVGSPGAGSLQLDIPFDAITQRLATQVALPVPLDLTGRTITARVRLDAGLSTSADYPGGAKVYVKTGGGMSASPFTWADGGWVNLDGTAAPMWIVVSLDVDDPAWIDPPPRVLDPTDVVVIGVEIDTSGDAAAAVTTATLHVDSVCYQ